MEHWLLELGVDQWRGVLLILLQTLGVVLEVMQRLQGVLQVLVLELLLRVVVVLTGTVLVPVQTLVLEEFLKLLEGFSVGHKPVLGDGKRKG